MLPTTVLLGTKVSLRRSDHHYLLLTRARVRILKILLTCVCSALPQQLTVPVALFPLDGVKLAPGPDGEQNGSYEFSGDASSRIEFPNDGGLNMNDSFTLLVWL